MASKSENSNTKDQVPWYEKALSIKPEASLSVRIFNFVTGLPEDRKPTTAKGLLIALLDATESTVSNKQLEQMEELHLESLELINSKLDQAIKNTESLREENEGFKQKTISLQQETDRLLEENQRLNSSETIDSKFFEQLKLDAPSLFSAQDKTMSDSINRFKFLFEQLDGEIAKQVNITEQLEENLRKALKTLIQIKPGQVIVSFPHEHLDNIKLMREILERMGHVFESQHPQEVIHAAIAAYIELLKQLYNLGKQFKPIEKIISNA